MIHGFIGVSDRTLEPEKKTPQCSKYWHGGHVSRERTGTSLGHLETLHTSFWTDTYCFPPSVQLILAWASPQAKRFPMSMCECMSSPELTDSCSQLTRASHKTLVTSCWWDHYKMAELVMTHISIIASEGVNEAALEWEQAAQANSCIIDINRAARIRRSTRNTLKSCSLIVFFCLKINVKMQ